MSAMAVLFWILFAIPFYGYVGYPSIVGVMAAMLGREPARGETSYGVSVVISAYNEAESIGRRIREFARILSRRGTFAELVIVSDGSTDQTVEIAEQTAAVLQAEIPVRLVRLSENVGKAEALSQGCAIAANDIIVFADARQSWADDALDLLLENFHDPRVGAVSGDLVLQSAGAEMEGVGLYWRYEKWIRVHEGVLHSVVGVTGAISAVRKSLFRPVPRDTILDDVYWPMQVVMQRFRVVHDTRAQAFDVLPRRSGQEFRRKTRTLCGNIQLLQLQPSLLIPWRNPLFFQFFSHKLIRLLVPWALLGLLFTGAALRGRFYLFATLLQLLLYAVGGLGIIRPGLWKSRIISALAAFIVLNAAAFVAFWIWLSGRQAGMWKKTRYIASDLAAISARGTSVRQPSEMN